MTIDWHVHEAEIRRLYGLERKTLPQVREILKNKHGFEASKRSWRSILAKWGLQRRELSNGQQRKRTADISLPLTPQRSSSTETSRRSSAALTTSVDPFVVLAPGIIIPQGEISVIDTKRLIEELSYKPYALEILVSQCQWHSSSDFLHMARGFILDHAGVLDIWKPCSSGLSIFEMLNTCSSPLIHLKGFVEACLYADLRLVDGWENSGCSSSEGRCWREAYLSLTWEKSMTTLRSVSKLWTNNALRHSAVSIIADHKLVSLELLLENYMESVELSAESSEFLEGREEYLMILGDLALREFKIDSSWYRFSAKLHDWSRQHDATVREASNKRLQDADRYRNDYLKLQNAPAGPGSSSKTPQELGSPSISLNEEFISQPLDSMSVVEAENSFITPNQILIQIQNVEEMDNELHQSTAPAAYQVTFSSLVADWKSGHDSSHHLSSLVTRECGSINSLSLSNTNSGEVNLFALIIENVPSPERMRFAKWILLGLNDYLQKHQPQNAWLKQWRAIQIAPTWDEAVHLYYNFEDTILYAMPMAFRALSLLLDSTLLVAGETRLATLRASMAIKRASYMTESLSESYRKERAEYKSILRTFRHRKPDLDQPWEDHLSFLAEKALVENV